MNGKPRFASGYQPEAVERVQRTLLLVAARFEEIPADHAAVVLAKDILREDFIVNTRGRLQVAQFITGRADDALQADALAQVNDLLRRL